MAVFVARQPILDRSLRVFGYELLFRSGWDNAFHGTDGDQATSVVLTGAYTLDGLERLTGGQPAFVNFTSRLLTLNLAALFPADWLIVEILEDVVADDELMAACSAIKQAGYRLALDDFVYRPDREPFLDMADIVKIDFRKTEVSERRSIAARVKAKGASLLAEKVETRQEFHEAFDEGFNYFQGYFFSRPRVISGHDIPAWSAQSLRLIREIQKSMLDFESVARIIRQEVSLTYKLLRYINSPFFGIRDKTSSVERAMALLGEEHIRKWLWLNCLSIMSRDGPVELARMSFIRALFCEYLAENMGLAEMKTQFFLAGLFSLIDTILARSIKDVLSDLPLPDEVVEAIQSRSGPLGACLDLAVAYERGHWEAVFAAAERIGLEEDQIPRLYMDAVLTTVGMSSD
jgi:EAL and modified HD-GYP domain-containing signal transduction protein